MAPGTIPPRLPLALRAWPSDAFSRTLKAEIEQLPPGSLPLEAGVCQGGFVDDSRITVTVLGAADDDVAIQVRVGIFFTEIVVNCGCGDDPMEQNAYCALRVAIDKATARAEFTVLPG
jgi:hypothetical protein